MKYQNETFTKGASSAIRVDIVDGTTASFKSAVRSFSLNGIPASANAFAVRLTMPTKVKSECEPCVSGKAEQYIEIRGNILLDLDPAIMVAEVNRLYQTAVLAHLHKGIVPNVNANLDSE